MIAPFPWARLPRVDRRSTHVVAAARAWLRGATHLGEPSDAATLRGATDLGSPDSRGATDLGMPEVRVVGGDVLAGEALERRLADPAAGVAVVRGVGVTEAYVVVPNRVVRELAQRVLGGPDELDAPRPLTIAERAVLDAAVAAALAGGAADPAIVVEPSDLGGPLLPARLGGEAAVVELAVSGPVSGTALVALPVAAILSVPRRPLARVAAAAPGALADAPVAAPLIVAVAALTAAELAALRVRDVFVAARVAPRGQARLRIGRGGIPVALAAAYGRVTVLAPYTRDPMDETLGDDATVDVAVAVGDVRMSVRTLLDLAPGQVLELGRPLGTAVELRVGPRVVARGELVDVDGDVGVRILSIEGSR